MQLLDAAIAFSLTMLAFATVVSVLLEVIRHFSKARTEDLKRFLAEYYKRELGPSLASGVLRAKGEAAERVAGELDSKIEELLKKLQPDNGKTGRLPPPPKAAEEDEVDTFQLVNVTTDEMIDRLRQSELGGKIVTDLKDEADAVFEYVAKRYERFGEVFSASFRKHSQKWTVGLSLVLAFAVNVDSIHLIRAYMSDETTRNAVIEQGSTILKESKDALDSIDGQPGGQNHDTSQRLRESTELLVDRLNAFETNPFPVGWSQFPLCPDHSTDPRCLINNAPPAERQHEEQRGQDPRGKTNLG